MAQIAISIHTPVKGVTGRRKKMETMQNNFNPHSREGSDLEEEKFLAEANNISIHTPVKGVTERILMLLPPFGFQSTLP